MGVKWCNVDILGCKAVFTYIGPLFISLGVNQITRSKNENIDLNWAVEIRLINFSVGPEEEKVHEKELENIL